MATYAVTGMTCQNCRAHAEEALGKLMPGAVVTLVPPRAILPGEIDEAAANAALAKAGGYKLAERVDGHAPTTSASAAAAPGGASSPMLLAAAGIVIAALALWGLGVF